MKKLTILLCLFTLFFAFTCENEPLDFDSESTQTETELLGDWDLVEFDVSVSSTTNFQGQEFTSDVQILSIDENYTLSFTAGNYSTSGGYTLTADVITNGVEVSGEPYSIENITGSGSYSVNGNEMIVDGSFFEFTFDGIDLSQFQGEQTTDFQVSVDGQTLTFFQNETTNETDATTGITTTNVIVSSSVWTRQ
ncbi:hypothetical protein [Winogradskyella aquimaris]|uniref:Lipocalin-like domain-containing protein n=1 Tax=Winogradskyella aquimaris TaxID=864074 RepID=A0ABU5EJP0_9FLAO|nr:hypothetical protein [Winogradskyella aquimaris]MDY2586207.1 hypothetical protein [Winogradskyella aquimaris]